MTTGKPSVNGALGANVRTRREALKLSQHELGLLIGSNNMTVSRIERGHQPRLETAQALAKALGCTLDDLVGTKEAA